MLYLTIYSRAKSIFAYLVIIIGIAFMITFAFTWYLCDRLMYPQRIPITRTPTFPYKTVQLKTEDGVTIRGWFIPAPPGNGKVPAILLLHGVADNRNFFNLDCNAPYAKQICPIEHATYPRGTYPTLIDALHWHGYALLAIDQRAEGQSGGAFCTYGLLETRDVAAALIYLQHNPTIDQKKLGIYGSSMGSMTAIHAAAQMPAFRAVAVESPFANLTTTLKTVTAPLIGLPGWMVGPLLKLYQLRTGVNLTEMRNINDMAALGKRSFYAIGDLKDTVTLPGDARKLYNASHGTLRELWEVPDAHHTEARFLHPDEFDQRLIAFFDKALRWGLSSSMVTNS